MMKKWLLAVLFGAVLTLAACGGDDDGASEEPADTSDNATEESADNGEAVDTAAGEEVYQTNCAMCHGADLAGTVGPELTEVGGKFTQDEIADIVTNGIGQMQPQDVEGEDLDALTAWLAEKK